MVQLYKKYKARGEYNDNGKDFDPTDCGDYYEGAIFEDSEGSESSQYDESKDSIPPPELSCFFEPNMGGA